MLNDEIRAETEVWAISVDGREMRQAMIDRILMDNGGEPPFYRMLTDVDHKVIDRYGLFNPEESKGRPVPHPTVMVVDRDGVVRWKFIEINYKISDSKKSVTKG